MTEIIIALDLPNKKVVEQFLEHFPNESLYLKVGMELFYQEGPAIVHFLKEKGHRIFLDLKMHDIPNTVKSAMRNIASLGVDMINLHAAGGKKMMQAAVEGLMEGSNGNPPVLIAVTQLTSTSKEVMNSELRISGEVADTVEGYARVTKEAGLDGVVCSVHEARRMHELFGADFVALTPGIRLATDDNHDQTRVATPKFAKEEGSTYIVVGRSVTRAENPLDVYRQIQGEIGE